MPRSSQRARRLGVTFVALLPGCVGVNPEWDAPAEATIAEADATTAPDREGETGTSSSDEPASGLSSGVDGGTTDGGGSTSTDAETSGTLPSDGTGDGSSDGSSDDTSDGGPACPPGEQLCGDACTDVSSDRHNCGAQCLNCTPMLGPDAVCIDGVCRPGDGDETAGD